MRDRFKPITPPQICPACNTTLVWKKDQIFCENLECEGKTSKKVEHFAKTLKIKGLGPATIEKLQINFQQQIDTLHNSYKLLISLIFMILT